MTREEIRDNIIIICNNNLGVVESPPNSNMTKFGEWYGMNGVSWCGIAVSYVYNYAGWCLPKIDTENGFHYVPTMYYRAIQNGWFTNNPKSGDIFIIDFNGDGRFDHTGIFDKWIGVDKFKTFEGNTSPNEKGSQSNGGGFFSRVRTYNISRVKFINILDNYHEKKH